MPTHVRRDLPLRRSGMQVRRQPIRRASPRLRATQIYAVVLMFLCVMTVISLGSSTVFEARHLVVYGARFTGDETVSGIVGMGSSPNLFRLRTDRVANALANLPAVESARVEVSLPDTVVVTVVEREPRLVWVIGDQRYVVDDSGFIFGQVDAAGNPIYAAPGTLTPGSTAPAPGPDASSATSPSAPDPGASVDGSPAAATNLAGKGVAASTKPAAGTTPKTAPKASPKASPSPSPTAAPSSTASFGPPPSLLPVPTADPAGTPGPQVVNLPVVYDRRAGDAGLSLGDVVDPIALDAGYRLAGLTPVDVGSQTSGLDVVLDDQYGFTVSSGADGWVAQFGFYTQTLRKDTAIPEQVQNLRSVLLEYGENHVAWVFLVADIAGNRIDTYIRR